MPEVARVRTAHQTAEYFKQQDPETNFAEYHINRLIKSGTIPVFQSGRRRLINLDKLIAYLSSDSEPDPCVYYGKIRKVNET